jgi:polysaccharide export outer membrane protein
MMRRVLILAAALVVALFAWTPEPQAAEALAAAPTLASASSPQYRIGTDDMLDVTVFQVPELTRSVQVDTNGEFILPLVGRVSAAGKTADEVGALLFERLNGRYLKDPLITVVVKQSAINRITVDGAVTKPGVYPLVGPTTLMQAIALANGPDARVANLRKVEVFRLTNGQRRPISFDLAKIREGKAPDPPVFAQDIVVVGASGARSFFTYFGPTLPILAFLIP